MKAAVRIPSPGPGLLPALGAGLLLTWMAVPFPSGSVRAVEEETASLGEERTRSAIAVWQEYQDALRDGDEERARACWTPAARQRSIFDIHFRFDQAVASARHDSMAIADARDCGRYILLRITSPHWQETPWGGPPGRNYYVVSTPKALLANPVEVLTDGWQERTTRYFRCHYPKDSRLTDVQAERLDTFCHDTSSRLGIGSDRPIDYYMCDSSRTVGALMGSGPAAGRAGIEDRIVAAMGWTSFHEVVHVLFGQTCHKQPDSPILEGAACYFGGSGLITRETQLSWARTLMENDEAMPLAVLLDERGFWSAEDMNDPYAEAAAFTGFLIERYGVDDYKTLYRFREEGSNSLQGAIERIYGREVPQLETEWKRWLLDLDLPSIGLGTDDHATEIFRMTDPPGDDNGEGTYVYPLASEYKPGMFDLTGFRVLSDANRLYFELTYRDLVEWPASAGWGFGGTRTRIAIDCGGKGEEGIFTFHGGTNASVAGHWDYLIDVSDCGVVLVEGDRIAACLKRVPPRQRLGDPDQDRIRFSVPCREPEESRRQWRYAVAVGGGADCGRQFRDTAGGFLKVEEHASEHTGGGGGSEGTHPNLYDILLPAGRDQGKVLSARPALLPMAGG